MKGKTHILVVNGVNFLGRNLTRAVLDQGAHVSMLAAFNKEAREYIKQFKERSFKFFDTSMVTDLRNKIDKLDYVIVLLENLPKENLETSELLKWQEMLNHVYELAYDKDAQTVVVTSMAWKKTLETVRESEAPGYIPEEIQMFAERALKEYIKQSNLAGKIVRVGKVYGKGMDPEEDSGFVRMVNQALSSEEIDVPGDGLSFTYYVHVLDAVYGILKAAFTKKAKGQTFMLANPEEISLLTLAHKILEHTVVAKRVNFQKDESGVDPLFEKGYTLAPNLSELGWKPKITFDRGLAQTIDYFKALRGIKVSEKTEQKEEKVRVDDGVKLSIKMDDVLPVEMTEERKRFEKIKKEKAARKKREFKLKAGQIARYIFTGLGIALGLALYFFILVPVIGIGRTIYSTRNSLDSYIQHLEAGQIEALEADAAAVEASAEELEVYLARMSWLFKATNTSSGADRIVANVYAARSTMKGFDHLLELENGQQVIVNAEEPSALTLRDRQEVLQAKLELQDAGMWYDKGARIPPNENFWAPYSAAEAKVDTVLGVL